MLCAFIRLYLSLLHFNVSRPASRINPKATLLRQSVVVSSFDRFRGGSYELPISTPVMKTNTPPKPTCNAAEIHGVSM
jgi:hypothetical protein